MNESQNFAVFYNRHYIKTDERGRIIGGWSDGPHPDRDITGAICINETGGYQFRLTPDGGEENPALYTMDGIPLYHWDGEQVICRSAEEIAADKAALPSLDPVEGAGPTEEEDTAALLVDHEFRLTLLELGVEGGER